MFRRVFVYVLNQIAHLLRIFLSFCLQYGYDTNSDKFDHGQFGGYGGNKFGTFRSDGRMSSFNYHGDRHQSGPYEIVKRNGIWKDVSGMIDDGNRLNVPVTDNYYIDALGIQIGVGCYQATLDVSGTIYKN